MTLVVASGPHPNLRTPSLHTTNYEPAERRALPQLCVVTLCDKVRRDVAVCDSEIDVSLKAAFRASLTTEYGPRSLTSALRDPLVARLITDAHRLSVPWAQIAVVLSEVTEEEGLDPVTAATLRRLYSRISSATVAKAVKPELEPVSFSKSFDGGEKASPMIGAPTPKSGMVDKLDRIRAIARGKV